MYPESNTGMIAKVLLKTEADITKLHSVFGQPQSVHHSPMALANRGHYNEHIISHLVKLALKYSAREQLGSHLAVYGRV